MKVTTKLIIINGDKLIMNPVLPVIITIKTMLDIIEATIASIEPLKALSLSELLFADLFDNSLIVVFALTKPPSNPTIDNPLL